MNTLQLELIVALSQNRVIGRANQLPWHLPDDLRFFKQTTLGLPVLMGRKTYASIGKPLPGRLNVVISRTAQWTGEQLQSFASIEAAITSLAKQYPRVMVIGGAQIFAELLPKVSVLHLTEVAAEVAGDVFFPAIDSTQWQEVWSEEHRADDRHAYAFRFVRLVRRTEL